MLKTLKVDPLEGTSTDQLNSRVTGELVVTPVVKASPSQPVELPMGTMQSTAPVSVTDPAA